MEEALAAVHYCCFCCLASLTALKVEAELNAKECLFCKQAPALNKGFPAKFNETGSTTPMEGGPQFSAEESLEPLAARSNRM